MEIYNKRKNKRVRITLDLVVSTLFNQDQCELEIDSPIEVTDISKGGIGFTSRSILPVGFYFNAALNLDGKNSILYCVVRIIRCEALEDDEYSYGCEFIGMAPVLDYIFDNLEMQNP